MNTVKADRLFYSTCALTLGTAIGNLLGPNKNTTDTSKLVISAGMSHSALVTSYERVQIINTIITLTLLYFNLILVHTTYHRHRRRVIRARRA